MIAESTTDSLGTVLVTGGCGFLGYHLVRLLLQESECASIYVLSRNPTSNLQDGVTYRAGSISDAGSIRTLLDEIKPKVIFHTASLAATDMTASLQQFQETNVKGTEVMLTCAREAPSVKAFIYTSSVAVYEGTIHLNVDENYPLWGPSAKSVPYNISKATADKLVLEYNTSQLRTISLRLVLTYGERDRQFIPGALEAYYKGQTNLQIGDNRNLLDTLYVKNAAAAHVLAAKTLLESNPSAERVDGEAFNISDGAPILYWNLVRTVWFAAGDKTQLRDIKIIPAWVAFIMADFIEWVYWLFTLNWKKPQTINRYTVEFCVNTHTYDIGKAKKRLGYNPVVDLKGEIQKAVDWEVRKRAELGKEKEK